MVNWPITTTVKALRGFLGLTSSNRRFVKNYGVICKPLTSLLKKGQFDWDEEATTAFNELKHAMTTTLVLALPDLQKPFVLETDACGTGIGAVLMQDSRPLAYLSKALAPKHLGLSTYEKELLAVIEAIKKRRSYLLGNHFKIKTDHQSLKFFMEQRLTTLLQQKWLSKMLGYDYEIIYKKGCDNIAADALSRRTEDTSGSQLNMITLLIAEWMKDVSDTYINDEEVHQRIQGYCVSTTADANFSYKQGILRYKDKLFIGKTGDLKKKLFQEMHDSPLGGHSGVKGTLKILQQYFFWNNMQREVQQ